MNQHFSSHAYRTLTEQGRVFGEMVLHRSSFDFTYSKYTYIIKRLTRYLFKKRCHRDEQTLQQTYFHEWKCKLRSKFWWLTRLCNSHDVSHFAAFFIVVGAKTSIAESVLTLLFSTSKKVYNKFVINWFSSRTFWRVWIKMVGFLSHLFPRKRREIVEW